MLTYEDIQEVIKFCAREKLVLFADEVYQDNVYAEGAQCHSCKKVLKDLGDEYSGFQLISPQVAQAHYESREQHYPT